MVNHRVELGSPKLFGGGGKRPALLERTDRRFMQNVLAELGEPTRHDELRETVVVERKGGGFHLYQPVHRVFHLAVVSAICADMPGRPRVDPAKIDSAGLVVRKVRDGGGRALGELGWIVAKDGTSRWEPPDLWDATAKRSVPPASEGPSARPYADPDPARRPRRSTGQRELDERIAVLKQLRSSRSESVAPLFPLTPQACAAAGETMLVGLVPTASRETEQQPSIELPTQDELEGGGFFPTWLLASASGRSVPFANQSMSVANVHEGGSPRRLNPGFADYMDFVREMVVAFDVGGDSPASAHLRALLEAIAIPFTHPSTSAPTQQSLYTHLLAAAKVTVDGDRSASFRMPDAWGQISAAQEAELKQAILAAATARFAGVSLDRPRFGESGASYVTRTFIRVRRDDGCPPELVWSQPSAEFQISAWYENSPGPRATIELPNPLRGGLAGIKPNVAFAVPSAISNLLGQNSPEDLLGGKGNEPSEGGLMWLCSFSIPIITICAFIVLSIIINLLNFVFWWLPFVKICIPIPKSK